ncbi:hypothetical protein LQZ19_07345 [Treponema primitia]|uniref:type II toxin-antitoxin system RelE family toxin n=1 Tax=Treponema primitia TaxID=88058 RepID=UPI00397FDD97
MKYAILISPEFFGSFSELPKIIQRKTLVFFEKLFKAPNLISLNLEKLKEKIDGKDLHSARIDKDYRAIIYIDDKSSGMYLLWIDIHDSAYKKKERVNSITISGKAQLMPIDYFKRLNLSKKKAECLFDNKTFEELREIGVPFSDIGFIKNIPDYNSFKRIKGIISDEVYTKLDLLALDLQVESIINNEIEEREKILNYLREKVLYPAIADDSKLDYDYQESIKNTIFRLEEKENAKEIMDFYKDALKSKRGKQMLEAEHNAGLTAFEDLEDEIKIKFSGLWNS